MNDGLTTKTKRLITEIKLFASGKRAQESLFYGSNVGA